MVILCGGRGTRLQVHTQAIPKPLVQIGGMPILWHVISLYAAQGHEHFLLATGYKRELIEHFVADHRWPHGVQVSCVDTGRDTPTGGRVRAVGEMLGRRRFAVTYADGVADVNLAAVSRFHDGHDGLPRSPWSARSCSSA